MGWDLRTLSVAWVGRIADTTWDEVKVVSVVGGNGTAGYIVVSRG